MDIDGALMAAATMAPLLGSAGDAPGKNRVTLSTLGIFVVGSIDAAAGDSFGLLAVGRVLHGAGLATGAMSIALIRDLFPAEKLAPRISLISVILGISSGAGVVIAGLLTQAGASPRSMFWGAALVALIAPRCGSSRCDWRAQESPAGMICASSSNRPRVFAVHRRWQDQAAGKTCEVVGCAMLQCPGRDTRQPG